MDPGYIIIIIIILVLSLAIIAGAFVFERNRRKTAKKPSREWRYCPWCADHLHMGEIDGTPRLKCPSCTFVHWDNPKVVAITLVPTTSGGAILIRRSIPPKVGMLALPGGYVEKGETPEQGAKREVKQEAGLDIEIERLLWWVVPPGINEILMFFVAKPTDQVPTAGPETSEAIVLDRDTLSVTELAFSTHRKAVEDWLSGEQY